MLSVAYLNLSKNAWKAKDRGTVETNLRLALNEGWHAVTLDPDNQSALEHLEATKRKLDDLIAPRSQRTSADRQLH